MAESSGDVLVDVPLTDAVDVPIITDDAPPSSSSSSPASALAAAGASDALPSPTFSLTAASQFLYSDQQRERAETTDDGVSPYLLLRRKFYTAEQWQTLLDKLAATRTLYVGNLSFYTTEAQLMAFFSQCGRVVKVVMGLNERTMTPCGFCFVEFSAHQEALDCQRHLSGLMADERIVRADLDPGFEEGRQFGRSKLTGGQIRDDHRKSYDPGRGGYVLTQATTFTSLTPGVLVIRPSHSRKKQKIDLAAVRASRRGRGRGRGGRGAQDRPAAAAEQKTAGTGKEKVGSKRRRDEDEEEDVRQREEEDDGGGEGEGMEGGEGGVGMGGDGEEAVDEVVTSGAEGDIESAAEVSGDGESDTRADADGNEVAAT